MSEYIYGKCGCIIVIYDNGKTDISHACTEHKIMVFSKALKEVKK